MILFPAALDVGTREGGGSKFQPLADSQLPLSA